ncbi:hypothetical protein [Chryseobacterium lathyri]|nr:hypothetical protein [Chryseobacterium lathyri]MDQ0065234.1 hypothetical protein [Chryseobacterium lathyri]
MLKALAGYIFSSDQKNIDRLIHSLSFGGGRASGIENYYGENMATSL